MEYKTSGDKEVKYGVQTEVQSLKADKMSSAAFQRPCNNDTGERDCMGTVEVSRHRTL